VPLNEQVPYSSSHCDQSEVAAGEVAVVATWPSVAPSSVLPLPPPQAANIAADKKAALMERGGKKSARILTFR
jgi:hypothetical protein